MQFKKKQVKKKQDLFFITLAMMVVLVLSLLFSCGGKKQSEKKSQEGKGTCVDSGPQSPRNIDNSEGSNDITFSVAPSYKAMNLCNIHFHLYAEHKAKDFSINTGDGENGLGGGYQCTLSKNLTEAEIKVPNGDIAGLKPGDTIEVHWVYSTCDVKPGKGLGSCLSDECGDPQLRVEAQVFVLVNDPLALSFADLSHGGAINKDGFYQAKALPKDTGDPVVYLGSTTGPKYDHQTCSPFQVTWSVRPQCAKLNIISLGDWLKNNVFEEKKAHGVRKLVTDIKLLSKIK